MILRVIISNPIALWKQPGSWLIRKVDKTPGSHVSIILDTITGATAYEAVFPKSKKSKYSEWLKHNKAIKEYYFEVPNDKQYLALEYLEKQVGKPYSVPQLALIALDYLVDLNYTNINGGKWLICSELAAGLLTMLYGVKFNETQDTIGVSDIDRVCLALTKSLEQQAHKSNTIK